LDFISDANDLLREALSICKEDESMFRGSTSWASLFLCSGCGNNDEQPLVDSECESSSPLTVCTDTSLAGGREAGSRFDRAGGRSNGALPFP